MGHGPVILPDVGVWLAGVWGRHSANPRVAQWWEREDATIIICRVTQMSLLRLLTNPSVMTEDVQSRVSAWATVDRVMADPRVTWSDEAPEVEQLWRAFSARRDRAHKLWIDDYLAAFARAGRHTLVTLDKAMAKRHPSVAVTLL